MKLYTGAFFGLHYMYERLKVSASRKGVASINGCVLMVVGYMCAELLLMVNKASNC